MTHINQLFQGENWCKVISRHTATVGTTLNPISVGCRITAAWCDEPASSMAKPVVPCSPATSGQMSGVKDDLTPPEAKTRSASREDRIRAKKG